MAKTTCNSPGINVNNVKLMLTVSIQGHGHIADLHQGGLGVGIAGYYSLGFCIIITIKAAMATAESAESCRGADHRGRLKDLLSRRGRREGPKALAHESGC
jgi:hypothetical protein